MAALSAKSPLLPQMRDRRADSRPCGGWIRQGAAGRLQGALAEVEDLLEVPFDLLLVAVLRDGQLLDEERAGSVEHLPLAEGEVLVGAEEIEVAEDFRDL